LNQSAGSAFIDSDGDRLPDTFEDSFGTRWDMPQTYPSGYPPSNPSLFYLGGTDDEIECEKTALDPDPNVSPTSDWAFPGKQWH
jgi:hypothetical protein